MLYKIFVTLLMFSILMICLAQNFTEEAADTANPFIAQLSERLRPVWSFVYSPDGKTIACGSSDGSVHLYDAKTAKLITKIGGVRITRETTKISAAHQRIWGLAYSPDGRMLATGGSGGNVYLYDTETWDVEKAERITEHKEHPVTVTRLRFSPDGKTFVSESSDGTLYLWKTPSQ